MTCQLCCTQPGAAVGGGHAGYQVYECKNGRVAVAALEPHFAARLCAAAGITVSTTPSMLAPATQQTIATPGYAAKRAGRLTSWRETKTYRFT
jgi:crotonobetainyl-CoA:carnitine CoA-transferase CaiB-like acyl-CoA transferase